MRKTLLVFLVLLIAANISFSQNKKDDKGRRQGHWKAPNINGTLTYEGDFLDDIPQGKITYTHIKENYKYSELTYVNKDEVNAVFYHSNKNIKAKGKYIKDKKEGLWEYFNKDGVLISLENYKANKKHGTETILFEDGNKAIVKNWKNGIEDGPLEEYYNNGNAKFKGTYKDGQLEGYVEMFHYNGKTKVRGKYQFSVKNGLWLYYKDDGVTVERRETYNKGYLVEEKEKQE
jgi:antitoxin component YwqK of YwqJK toxin-antitoxin module